MLFAIEQRAAEIDVAHVGLGERERRGESGEKTKFEQLVTPLLRSILQSLCGEPVDINPCQVSKLLEQYRREGRDLVV